MGKRFLVFAIFVLFFLSFSENSNAALPSCAEPCDPDAFGDPCTPFYVSGTTCYYGASCKPTHHGFQCLSYATDKPSTNPLDIACYKGAALTGYVKGSNADMRTDLQCQNNVCTWVGWFPQNKPDGTPCIYNGKPSTCEVPTDKNLPPLSICKPLRCDFCDDGTYCGKCSDINIGQICKDVGGVGVLEPSLMCPICQKYTYTGMATGTGAHPDSMEVCYDTVVAGKFTQYHPEGCFSSGSIDEQVCADTDSNGQPDTCQSDPRACTASELCWKKYFNVALVSGGNQTLPFGYCSATSLPPLPGCNFNGIVDNGEPGPTPDCGGGGCPPCGAPCGGAMVCPGGVCANQCVPGDPPNYYDASCNVVSDCTRCGCAPSEYGGCARTCVAGSCGYTMPPPCVPPSIPPDCPVIAPDMTFDRTTTETTYYLISGRNTGTFYGYNWTGSLWQYDAAMSNAASVASNSAPSIFFDSGDIYMISGRGNGAFAGYNWTGTSWANYNAIINGLPDIGDDSKPSVFYMNGRWNMIAGNLAGTFRGFSLNSGVWAVNNTLIAGLINTGGNSAPAVFSKDGSLYLIAGRNTGTFSGYNWTGTSWQSDTSILSGLAAAGTFSSLAYYYNDTSYLIIGYDGLFNSYNWTGSSWQVDPAITAGLAALARASPIIFKTATTTTKTVTYKTRFPLERMSEYPTAGSQCFQNKTQIIIPEGHACRVEIYANSTHGWGVKMKATTTSGKTLDQDPFNVCGYINESIFAFCHPTGFGGTPMCPANITPVLQEGTYEFGITSSTGITSPEISKGCAYITECSDCENPYANYYCNLCTKDICNDEIQNCGESCIDGGGPCTSGKETDNNYFPLFVYSQPQGIQNTIVFSDSGGINCVDGIDNDKDCSVDCADPDCVASSVCSMDNLPPTTTITIEPPANKKGWYLTPVNITLTCTDIGGSGCAATSYRIDGGAWNNTLGAFPVKFLLSGEGTHIIEYYSTDKAGNIEALKTAKIRIFTSEPFSIQGDPDLTVPLGKTGQAVFKLKNLMDTDDSINITVFSTPIELQHWTWLSGHRYDANRYVITLPVHANEERPVPIDVFGGKAPYSGKMNITAESEGMGIAKSVLVNVNIVYSEDGGMTVETPEYGWYYFALIAILGAILI